MDAPHRIKIKYFVQDPAALDMMAFTPIFHRWIQEKTVAGMLLDVADYLHVTDGPGIVLIGHEADYALDLQGGRPGLVYDRKRGWGPENALESGPESGEALSLADRLHLVFRGALAGCQVLEADATLAGRVRFVVDEAELSFVDRLRTPNHEEVYAELTPVLHAVLDDVYGRDAYTFARTNTDPRHALTVHIKARSAGANGEVVAVSDLLARVKGSSFVSAATTNGAVSNGHV